MQFCVCFCFQPERHSALGSSRHTDLRTLTSVLQRMWWIQRNLQDKDGYSSPMPETVASHGSVFQYLNTARPILLSDRQLMKLLNALWKLSLVMTLVWANNLLKCKWWNAFHSTTLCCSNKVLKQKPHDNLWEISILKCFYILYFLYFIILFIKIYKPNSPLHRHSYAGFHLLSFKTANIRRQQILPSSSTSLFFFPLGRTLAL